MENYRNGFYRFMNNCLSICIYTLLFGGMIYIGDFGLTTGKHLAISMILAFFAGLGNDICRRIEDFNLDILEQIKKAYRVETAMKDLEKKIKAFSEMHKGKSSDDILAEMRGEEPRQEDKPITIKGINGNEREIPNSAWSEEDEKIYNRIYDLIHAAAFENYDVDEDGKELGEYAKITSWFKHLKDRVQPQITWKPSDEQMYILNWVANILLNHDGVVEEEASKKLQSLYNDLKKL